MSKHCQHCQAGHYRPRRDEHGLWLACHCVPERRIPDRPEIPEPAPEQYAVTIKACANRRCSNGWIIEDRRQCYLCSGNGMTVTYQVPRSLGDV